MRRSYKLKRTILIALAASAMLAVLVFCALLSLRAKWDSVELVMETAAGEQSISLYNDGDMSYAFLPSYTDTDTLRLSVPDGCELSVGGRVYDGEGFFASLPLDEPLDMSLRLPMGMSMAHRLIIKKSSVPALYITLIDGDLSSINNSIDHKVGRAGTCSLITGDGKSDYSGSFDRLRGRGNVTWEENKKPYNIDFKEPTDLLGMGKGLRYCLLANALDKSNVRDKIVYDAAIEAGLEYSAESRFVDLYVDGEYLGLYLMSEDVQLREDRVDITDLSALTAQANAVPLQNYKPAHTLSGDTDKRYFDIANDPEDITGGYLIELDMADRYELFNSGFMFGGNEYCYTVKSPEYCSGGELDYISGLFRDIEDDLAAGRLNERIDIDSWVRYYLVQEVFANFDPCSLYFYKDSDSIDGKIYAGPIWDFDKALGSPVYEGTGSPNRLYAAEHTIFAKLYANDEFRELVREKYAAEFIPLLDDILSGKIDEYNEQIASAAHMNELRWEGEKLHSWEPVFSGFDGHLSYVRDFLRQRKTYLDTLWLGGNSITVDYCSYSPIQEIGFFSIEPGTYAGALPELSCDGWRFDGWYDSETGEPYVPSEPLYVSRTFIAKWTRTSSPGFVGKLRESLESFAERQNWTVNKLINYAAAGALAGAFAIALAAFFIAGLIRRKRGVKK